MPDLIANKVSDFGYVARSHKLVNPDDGAYNLIRLPKNAFVTDVWLDVETAGTGGTPNCTASVGFTGNSETADPDGFIDTTLGDTTGAGVIRATDDAQPGSKGKWFNDGSGMLTATFAKGTTTTGPTVTLFVAYHIIS